MGGTNWDMGKGQGICKLLRSVLKQAGRVSSSMVVCEPTTFWPLALLGMDSTTKPCWGKIDIHIYKHSIATVIVICGC
jgi:hypothetical protein